MEDKVAIRLKVFIESQGLSYSQFADTCGLSRPSLSQLLSGRNKKISDIIVGQIHRAFPSLSVLWLLFGEGKMLVDQDSSIDNQTDLSPNIDSGNISNTQNNIETGHRDIFEPNLFTQNEESLHGVSEICKKGNVRGLNSANNTAKVSVNQKVDTDDRTVELIKQLEKMRKNPRKVVQITVYYDDSTFETFLPGKN